MLFLKDPYLHKNTMPKPSKAKIKIAPNPWCCTKCLSVIAAGDVVVTLSDERYCMACVQKGKKGYNKSKEVKHGKRRS